ncbi:4377_t:CDS:1, partial [Racocetra fulgida]
CISTSLTETEQKTFEDDYRTKEKTGRKSSPIAALIPPYSIVADIRDKPANITFSQLLTAIPSMRTQLAKGLQRKK